MAGDIVGRGESGDSGVDPMGRLVDGTAFGPPGDRWTGRDGHLRRELDVCEPTECT
jgi:hypothetical protein